MPHCDYEHTSMEKYFNKGASSRNDREDFLLPISFDLPLTEGGMHLSIYGVDGPNAKHYFKQPYEVEVPFGSMLIWR